MAIGDSRAGSLTANMGSMAAMHGVMVQVKRIVQADVTERSIYGQPKNYTPQSFNLTVLTGGQYLDEASILAGGKPKEKIHFIIKTGELIENDEVTYSGHTYKIVQVDKVSMFGSDALEMAEGSREVAA